MKLTDLKINQTARIKGFLPGSKLYRQKLLAMGLTPGVTITLVRIAPLGDPMEFRLRGFALSLRKKECQVVELELITASNIETEPHA